jgi:serine O-acetyltransferase
VRIGDPQKPTGKTPPIIEKFCKSLPEVRDLLRTDIEAAFEGDPAALRREEIILSYPFIEAISIQRLAHRLHEFGAPLIPRMMTEWAHSRTGIDIHPGANIGTHFFIDHGTGVVIGETSRIGNNVKIYHGVTLGARSFVKDEEGHIIKGGKRHPDVGDGVTIYPNSTILGGKTFIGANSTIGANVFLMQSVPPNSLVICEEARISIRDKELRPKAEELK